MSKNVLVTGGAGYIGSMTCKILQQYGYDPIVVDNLQTGFKSLVKFGPLEIADVGDCQAMTSIFKKYKPLAVIHFAANTSVSESVTNPGKYYYNNTANSISLLKTMRENNVTNIIFSSTAAVFGNAQNALITEQDPIQPINPYGVSKAMVEKVLEDFATAYNLNYIALRYFNVIGADPEMEVGECRLPGVNLVPIIFYQVMQGKDVLIYGGDYPTRDGTCIRDYMHVRDLAIAHVLAMQKLLQNSKNVKINLGNGKGYTVKEVVTVARDVMDIDFNIRVVDKREGDPACLVSDITFATNYLNWHPEIPDVTISIKHAWEWFQRNNEK